jgi:hypothetical protein
MNNSLQSANSCSKAWAACRIMDGDMPAVATRSGCENSSARAASGKVPRTHWIASVSPCSLLLKAGGALPHTPLEMADQHGSGMLPKCHRVSRHRTPLNAHAISIAHGPQW